MLHGGPTTGSSVKVLLLRARRASAAGHPLRHPVTASRVGGVQLLLEVVELLGVAGIGWRRDSTHDGRVLEASPTSTSGTWGHS